MTSMRVNRRLEELSGFHLGLLQYFLQKGWQRVQNGSVFPQNASQIYQNAEVKMVTVASRRHNPSSISDSKGGLYTVPTCSKRLHLEAQRCWANYAFRGVVLFFSGLFAVWACCKWLSRKPLPQKASARDPYIKDD